jgi:hypothetical protein
MKYLSTLLLTATFLISTATYGSATTEFQQPSEQPSTAVTKPTTIRPYEIKIRFYCQQATDSNTSWYPKKIAIDRLIDLGAKAEAINALKLIAYDPKACLEDQSDAEDKLIELTKSDETQQKINNDSWLTATFRSIF